jgi:type II secretory pathway pseudopilin PulG
MINGSRQVKQQYQGSCPGLPAQRGFTIFELVAYILVVSITVSAAYNRFADYPGEAERANFLGVLVQLKAGTNLQMMNAIAGGDWHELGALEGSNPMDLMLETPSIYMGAFDVLPAEGLPGRTWYFDNGAGELVYIANDARNLFLQVGGELQPTTEVRFRIRMHYGPGGHSDWQGLLLEPAIPYEWGSIGLTLPELVAQ